MFDVWDQPEIFALELLNWLRDHFASFHADDGKTSHYGRRRLVTALKLANTKKRPLKYTRAWCMQLVPLIGKLASACTRDADLYLRLFRDYIAELRLVRQGAQGAYTLLEGRHQWLHFAGAIVYQRAGFDRTPTAAWHRLGSEREIFKYAALTHAAFLRHICVSDALAGKPLDIAGAVGADSVPRRPMAYAGPLHVATPASAPQPPTATPGAPSPGAREFKRARKRERQQRKLKETEAAMRRLSITPEQLKALREMPSKKAAKKKAKNKRKRERQRASRKLLAEQRERDRKAAAPARAAVNFAAPSAPAAAGGGSMRQAKAAADAALAAGIDVTQPVPRFHGHYIYDFVEAWCREFNRQREAPPTPEGAVCGKRMVGKPCDEDKAAPPCTRYHGCPVCLASRAHAGGIFACPAYLRQFPG